MLKLYGVPMSNYFSMVKNALMEKDIHFEEVQMAPSQDPKYLKKSPMGKIPIIETDYGFLSESSAILDYLEDVYPSVPLYPGEPFERAKVKELMRVVEHYVETPAHSMLGILFGREVPQEVRDHFEPLLNRGLEAMKNLARFDPFILGEQLSYADLSTFWSLFLAGRIGKTVYNRNIMEEVDGLAEWNKMMLQRQSTSKLVAESKDYIERVLASQKR